MLSKAGGRYRVQVDGDDVVTATLRGRLKRKQQGPVLVGDRVELVQHPDGGITLENILPRRSLLRRRTPGRLHGVRDIAANVDQVIVMGAVREPEWNASLMDRFLAVAAANRLPAILVVNKCDLIEDPAPIAAAYRAAGYTVLLTSVPTGQGLEELRERLTGRISLVAGPTGVGKSSMLNRLNPGLHLRIADVSRRSRAGRHTTVAAEMHRLAEGGYVVDTPGLRDIGLWGLEPADVEAAFPEFARWAARCRFDDCRHLGEAGCALPEAVAAGHVAATRLESYRTLLDEALRAARPWQR